MEKSKKLVELDGEKGWLVQHTIKGNLYWYLHIYDPNTQKTNKTKYVGKELPESLQELNRVTQKLPRIAGSYTEVTQNEMNDTVTQKLHRDLQTALETIEHQKVVIETLSSQPSDIDREELQTLMEEITERIEVCIRSKRSAEARVFKKVKDLFEKSKGS